MNDFHATPVRWAEFGADFEASRLASQLQKAHADRDHESAMSLSQDFLSPWVWEHSSAIEESLPMTLGFYRLGAVTRAYQAIQPRLNEQTRKALDALLLPFIGQWLVPPAESSLTDLTPEMRLLAYGGLSFALAPERCTSIVSDLNSIMWAEEVEATTSGIGIDPDDRNVFSNMSKELISLISLAAQYRGGVIAVFEI